MDTARFFGPSIRLYQHQAEAIAAAKADKPYIVSSGTGSGKSLAYLVPIVDHVLRNNPADHSVRAIIVYPTNALINSHLQARAPAKRTGVFASGGSVYATLKDQAIRTFSTEGPFYAPAEQGKAENRVMLPLAFCRECGHEHYLFSLASAVTQMHCGTCAA